jgi:23S rRNA pseudouridine1911/1915/1917 synthase
VIAQKKLVTTVPARYAGKRLDQALVGLFPEFSRSRLQQWVQDGRVSLDRRQPKSSEKVKGGERVEIDVPEATELAWSAQAIALNRVYEDEQLLVINKPAGLVMHPGAGNLDRTLLNALLYHSPQLKQVARAGIVHRLDKETSGLLVVAKSEAGRLNLIEQLRTRALKREYLAIVNGVMIAGGDVEAPIGRHPRDRTRMTVSMRGRPAISHYRVQARYRAHTLVRIRLESGRTHQIRVHMTHIGHAIVGDRVYGGRPRVASSASSQLAEMLRSFGRQALHAAKLGLVHPETGKAMEWTAAVPADMQALVKALADDAGPPPPGKRGE